MVILFGTLEAANLNKSYNVIILLIRWSNVAVGSAWGGNSKRVTFYVDGYKDRDSRDKIGSQSYEEWIIPEYRNSGEEH